MAFSKITDNYGKYIICIMRQRVDQGGSIIQLISGPQTVTRLDPPNIDKIDTYLQVQELKVLKPLSLVSKF